MSTKINPKKLREISAKDVDKEAIDHVGYILERKLFYTEVLPNLSIVLEYGIFYFNIIELLRRYY